MNLRSSISPRRAILAVISPLLLVILFLRVVWGMWDYRDITSGDTASYYRLALDFSRHFTCHIAWSPIYTSYFGAWHWLNQDPYFVIIAHRIGILAVLTGLIYLLSRRLLTSSIAFFVTAWWLVLPINYNALYEVHLFALIPICCFWLLISWRQSLVVRGVCLGLLAVTTALMRNEILIALGIFGVVSVGYDLWEIYKGRVKFVPMRYLLAYGIPIVISVVLVVCTYWRSVEKYPQLSEGLKLKHTLNVAQIYSYGYSQRHSEYKDDPWSDYGPLMRRDFGRELLSMREAFQANPQAMLKHFLWNAALIPSGLQVSLFNCRSGDFNPDYAPTAKNPPIALTLSFLYLAIVATGGFLLIKNWKYWWDAWLKDRAWVIMGILAVCATVAVVMVMQRPRPSYMFAQTLAMMLLAGFGLQVIGHHLRIGRRYGNYAIIPMLAVTVFAPRGFAAPTPPPAPAANAKAKEINDWRRRVTRQVREKRPRTLLMQYQMLQHFPREQGGLKGRLAAAGYSFELTSYLDLARVSPNDGVIDTTSILASLKPGTSFDVELKKLNVRAVVIPFHQQKIPAVGEFVRRAEENGWTLVETREDLGRKYFLYEVTTPAAQPAP